MAADFLLISGVFLRLRFLSILIAGALSAGALAFAPVPTLADDAQALLAKHKAFVGWQLGDDSLKTFRLTGAHIDAQGKTLSTFTQSRVGLIYRTTYVSMKQHGITSDEGFTGNIVWQSNENGFTTPMFGDGAKLALAEDVLLVEGTTELPGTSRGSSTVDGKPVEIVRVVLPAGDAIDLYIDPTTGAYVQAVIDPDGARTETIHILSYIQAAPGKKIIGSYRYGNASSTWSYKTVEPNVALSNDALHPPQPRATWSFANALPFPFTVTDKRFIVDAKVNGVAGRFVVDTGADGIVLTRAFAARAHVKQFASGAASGIGGDTKTDVDTIDTLEVGGNTLANVVAYAQDQQPDDQAPDGLMGFDLFGGAIVKLDTAAQRMTIADPSTAAPASSGIPINVDLSDQVPAIPMKMDGTIDVNATLDTGNPYYVLFGTDLITKGGLRMLVDSSDEGYLEAHPIIGGIGGEEADRCGHVDSLALGPIVYQNAPACESGSFSGRDILVGFDFLRHFDYVFDYPHGHLFVTPHKE
jgi:hypothetical protein